MTRRGPNALGLNKTIKAMGEALGPDTAAVVALARGLAQAVDADPSNAALWREYRAAVTALKEAGERGDTDDSASFRLTIQTPVRASLGHAEDA